MTIKNDTLIRMIEKYNDERRLQALETLENNNEKANGHGHTAYVISNFIEQIAAENEIHIARYKKEEHVLQSITFEWVTINYIQIYITYWFFPTLRNG